MEKKKKKITLKIIPNTERVLIKLLQSARSLTPILMPGQLKAGENLHCGEIFHPGDTKFKKGQIVYYSEYSAAAVMNIGSVLRKEQSLGGAMKDRIYVVAADDIMAYEKDVFPFPKEVSFENEERRLTKKALLNQEIKEEKVPIIITKEGIR